MLRRPGTAARWSSTTGRDASSPRRSCCSACSESERRRSAMEFVRGSNRELIPAATAAVLRTAGALVEDARRERPRWFDGRFLAARDLVREQQYFLTREADLGRAAGSGVATGLDVTAGAGPQT